MYKINLIILASWIAGILSAVTVDPTRSVIVVADVESSIHRLAAKELQLHLRLATGREIPVVPANAANAQYIFHVGKLPDGHSVQLKPEEGRRLITANAAYFFGDDYQYGSVKPEADIALVSGNLTRSGTLFAVYDFLENVLGIHWVTPGNSGIVYRQSSLLELPEGPASWSPRLAQRQIRSGYSWSYYQRAIKKNTPEFFQISEADYTRIENDNKLWLKRMRMGRHLILNYGHAFCNWWEKYGETHPEYFALNEKGERKPLYPNQPDRIKMCVSNPAFQAQVVHDWWETRTKAELKQLYDTINVCENDSAGFCTCPNCMALDARKPGEPFTAHLTDRYVYLANQVTALAEKHYPEIYSVMYAYAYYRLPPRRQKVNPRVIIGAVPFMLSPRQENEGFYRGWRDAGAEKIFLRPNDQHLATGMPMGFEKAMFDAFKLGVDNGIIGTDYDSLHNFWPVYGFGDYILAKAHVDPAKPFEYWEDEYCSAYGAAAPEIKAYFAYWRDAICGKKLHPAMPKILEQLNGNNVFRTGIFRDNFQNYYTPEDFDRTDAILNRAATKTLSEAEKSRLEQLLLANRHARLTHRALAGTLAKDAGPSRELLEFRMANRDRMQMYWPYLFHIENTYKDITGVQKAYADMKK